MTRSRARSPRGTRAVVTEPTRTGVNISVVSALSIAGVIAPMTLEGSVDAEAFNNYVEHFLVPALYPKDIVIMDNVPFHLSERAKALIASSNAEVIFLPAYSPDLNPIEYVWKKVKKRLRIWRAFRGGREEVGAKGQRGRRRRHRLRR